MSSDKNKPKKDRPGRRARRLARENELLDRNATLLKQLRATERATGLSAAQLEAQRQDDNAGRLTTGERIAVGITSVFVLGISLIAVLVIIGLQTAFYTAELANPTIDVIGLFELNLAQFTPVATEGIVWACTLMAVVLVMLNRPAGVWTKAMWFFASIAAAVNTWHAATDGDVMGAFVKGGLSLAAPFVVHLYIHWVQHLRTGKTIVEHRIATGDKWKTIARHIGRALRTLAGHVLHPITAFQALSLFTQMRTWSYDDAWFAATYDKRTKMRKTVVKRKTPDPENPEEKTITVTEEVPNEAAIAMLGTQEDDDERMRQLFDEIIEPITDIFPEGSAEEQQPGSNSTDTPEGTDSDQGSTPDSQPGSDGGFNEPTSADSSLYPPQNPPSNPNLNPVDTGGSPRLNRDENPTSNRDENPSSTAAEPTHSVHTTTDADGEKKSTTERLVERFWADHHSGRRSSNKEIADSLDVPVNTVKTTRRRWNAGDYNERYPDPYTEN